MALPSRAEALHLIDQAFPSDPLVLTLGTTVREMLQVAGVKPNHLYVLDSMGLPPAIGLGLALGLERSRCERVVVVEGDGSLLMGFSALSTIGRLHPGKLMLIVLDNGTYAATGGQPSGAEATDFSAVARGCGFDGVDVDSASDLERDLARARAACGPRLVRVRINQELLKTPYFLDDPVLLGHNFADYLKRFAGE
jgi:thiamine pyrophosphate-dependent acetolactate synthase large subunit-like protein